MTTWTGPPRFGLVDQRDIIGHDKLVQECTVVAVLTSVGRVEEFTRESRFARVAGSVVAVTGQGFGCSMYAVISTDSKPVITNLRDIAALTSCNSPHKDSVPH